MNLSGLPEAAFVDPGGGNRASVDALAGRALNLVLSLAAEHLGISKTAVNEIVKRSSQQASGSRLPKA